MFTNPATAYALHNWDTWVFSFGTFFEQSANQRGADVERTTSLNFDFAYRQIRICAEHAKNRNARGVSYSPTTSRLLETHLRQRYALSTKPGRLFLSTLHRSPAQPHSLVMWSKIVEDIAHRTGIPRFTTPTPRHLHLTHMARAPMNLHQDQGAHGTALTSWGKDDGLPEKGL